MQEEIGTHYRVSVILVFTGGLVGVVACLLCYLLITQDLITSKYTKAVEYSSIGSILAFNDNETISCAQAYSSILESNDVIRAVYKCTINNTTGEVIKSTGDKLYYWKDKSDKLLTLINTNTSTKSCKILVEQAQDKLVPDIVVYIGIIDE